mmetsp:Transcript_103083/g.289947  ORF Transcript_103083/g.289947 Transcript_103083/m.289947 type:complete len:251 (-) Transcript_103083:219-971(-)
MLCSCTRPCFRESGEELVGRPQAPEAPQAPKPQGGHAAGGNAYVLEHEEDAWSVWDELLADRSPPGSPSSAAGAAVATVAAAAVTAAERAELPSREQPQELRLSLIPDAELSSPQMGAVKPPPRGPTHRELGIAVDVIDKLSAIVVAIHAGPVQRWNASNPQKSLEEGDRIMEVNGSRGNVDEMTQRLKVDDIWAMVIQRPAEVRISSADFDGNLPALESCRRIPYGLYLGYAEASSTLMIVEVQASQGA